MGERAAFGEGSCQIVPAFLRGQLARHPLACEVDQLRRSPPILKAYRFTWPSSPAVTIRCPSGLNPAERPGPVWPIN